MLCADRVEPAIPNNTCRWTSPGEADGVIACRGDEVMTGLCVSKPGVSRCGDGPTGSNRVRCCLTTTAQCSNKEYVVRAPAVSCANKTGAVSGAQMAATGVCSYNCDKQNVFGSGNGVPYMFYCQGTYFTYTSDDDSAYCAGPGQGEWSSCRGDDKILVGLTSAGCQTGNTKAVCRGLRYGSVRTSTCVTVVTNESMAWCPNGYVAQSVCAPNFPNRCFNGSTTALICCEFSPDYQGGTPCPVGFVYSITGHFRSAVSPSGVGTMAPTVVSTKVPGSSGQLAARVLDIAFNSQKDEIIMGFVQQDSANSVPGFDDLTKGWAFIAKASLKTGMDPRLNLLVGNQSYLGHTAQHLADVNATGYWTNASRMLLDWRAIVDPGIALSISERLGYLFISQSFMTVGNLDGPFWQRMFAGKVSSSAYVNNSACTLIQPIQCTNTGLYNPLSVIYRQSTTELFQSGQGYINRIFAGRMSLYVGDGDWPQFGFSPNVFRTNKGVDMVYSMIIFEDREMYFTDSSASAVVRLDMATGLMNKMTFTYAGSTPNLDVPRYIVFYRSADVSLPLLMYMTDGSDAIFRITMNNNTVFLFAGIERSGSKDFVDRVPLLDARFDKPGRLVVSRTRLYVADVENAAVRAIILTPCSLGFNASQRCLVCDEGYYKYPKCREKCTIEDDCFDRATAVVGSQPDLCYCACRWNFKGRFCEQCQTGYDDRAGCTRCAPGYVGKFPACRTPTISMSQTPSETPATESFTPSVSAGPSVSLPLTETKSLIPPPTKSKTPPMTESETHSNTRVATTTLTADATASTSLSRHKNTETIAPWMIPPTPTRTTGSLTLSPEGTQSASEPSLSWSFTDPTTSMSKTTFTQGIILPTATISTSQGSGTQTWSRTLPSMTVEPTLTRAKTRTPPPTTPRPPTPNPTPNPPQNATNGTSAPATTILPTRRPRTATRTIVITPAPTTSDPRYSEAPTPPPLTGVPPGSGLTLPPIQATIEGAIYVNDIQTEGPIQRRSLNITLVANAEFDLTACQRIFFSYKRSTRYDLSFLNIRQVTCLSKWRMQIVFQAVPRADCSEELTVGLLLHATLTLNRTLELTFPIHPIRISKAAEQAQSTANTGAVAVSAAGGSTANEMQGMALISLMSCASAETKSSLHSARAVMSPWKVGDDELGYITGNFLLVIIFSAAATLAQGVVYLKFNRDKNNGVVPPVEEFPDPTADENDNEPWNRAASLVHWPGRYLNFIALAHQGIAFESHLRFHSPERTPLGLFVGCIGLIYCIGIPVYVGWWIKKRFKAKYVKYRYLHLSVPFAVRVFTPKAFWLPLSYTKHYGSIFEEVGPQNVWFALYDPLIKVNIVSAIAAFQAGSAEACKAQYGLLTIIYGGEAIARIIRWPARTLVSNLSPLAACITTALLASSAGFQFSLLSTEIAMIMQSYLSITCGLLAVGIKMVDRRFFQPREIKARYENADFDFVEVGDEEKDEKEKEMKEKEKEDGSGDSKEKKPRRGKKKSSSDDELGSPLLALQEAKKSKKKKGKKGRKEASSSESSSDDGDGPTSMASPLLKLNEKKNKADLSAKNSGKGSTLELLMQFKQDVKAADEREADLAESGGKKKKKGKKKGEKKKKKSHDDSDSDL